MNSPAPVALFCYNRPDHTRQTVEALRLNPLAANTELHVFSDAPRTDADRGKVDDVRRFLKTIEGFAVVRVVERTSNLGLARSVISGVNEVFQRCERVVVMEDDIVTAPDYLSYMNQALDTYAGEARVFSITGFSFPIRIHGTYPFDAYFSYRFSSWGWATWRDRWNRADWDVKDYPAFKRNPFARRMFNRGGNDLADMLDHQMDGTINSWAIRWGYAHYKNDAFCVFPVQSRVLNIGLDGSGVHCRPDARLTTEMTTDVSRTKFRFPAEVRLDPQIQRAIYRFNSVGWKRMLKSFLKRYIS